MTFQWRPFTNPARKDGLELSHWVKCRKDVQDNVVPVDDGEYPFSKYNKKVENALCNLCFEAGSSLWSVIAVEGGRLTGICEFHTKSSRIDVRVHRSESFDTMMRNGSILLLRTPTGPGRRPTTFWISSNGWTYDG